MEPTDSWFVAAILSTCTADSDDKPELYEESFNIVKASSVEMAWEEAKELLTLRDVEPYVSAAGSSVRWTHEVVGVGPILEASLAHGKELFSRFFRNVQAYRALQFEDFERRPY